MINPVNLNVINFKGSSNLLQQFKEKNNITVSAPANLSTGTQALANYNKPVINDAKAFRFKVNISEPIKITPDCLETLNGVKVLNSSGNLNMVVIKGDKTTKKYCTPDGKRVFFIKEFDNATGNIIRKDYIGDNLQSGLIYTYDPKTGKNTGLTVYSDGGKLTYAAEMDSETMKIKKSAAYDDNGKPTAYYELDKQNSRVTHYAIKDGKIDCTSIRDCDDKLIEKTKYYNGKPGETLKITNAPVINTSGRDMFSMKIQPCAYETFETDISKVNGAKKLYSDGSVESIIVTDGSKTREYNIEDNKVNLIIEKTGDKITRQIRLTDDGKSVDNIMEYLDSDTTKTTYFINGKADGVEIFNLKTHERKGTRFYDNGNIKEIFEAKNLKSGEDSITFSFNREGLLYDIEEYQNGRLKDAYMHRTRENIPDNTTSPDNAEKTAKFKSRIKDNNWEKTYNPQTNTVFIKQKGLVDGTEYEIYSNGIVSEFGCWQKSLIIMNSNEEMIKVFNEVKPR